MKRDSFDKITLNSNTYFVKVRDKADKDYFYKIIDWIKNNGINFVLNEDNSYVEYR